MKAKTIHGKSTAEIESALAQSLLDGFKPTLAIVFISIKQDRKAICSILQQENIDILGATSCGEFTDGYQDEGSSVILLLNIACEAYHILFEKISGRTVSEAATKLAQSALQLFPRPAFIICSTGFTISGEYLDGEMLISGIEKVAGPQVTVCGGMAGDDGTLTGTYVFTKDQETDEGIAALILNEDKIEVKGMAISGWKPLGISRIITKSKGHKVYTIDNQPAPEMYLRFLGKESIVESHESFMEGIGFQYPFLLDRDKGAAVLRTPMSIDHEENALVCDLEMPQGATLRFSMPPDLDIVETIVAEANHLKDVNQSDADALLIFSCAGRIQVLGPLVTVENEGLQEIWKTPMAGFFTYGEYGRTVNGNPEFHSGTCSWVTLKEK
jgi:hypothetical protein